MKPTQSLPTSYELAGSLDLSKDKRLALKVNLLGLLLLLIAAPFFLWLALLMRQEDNLSLRFDNALWFLLLLAFILLFTTVIHEALHGLGFWFFTKERPKFGFTGLYAYAAAPDWYLPRKKYFVVALAPLVGITLAGMLLMPQVTQTQLPLLLLGIIYNFAGSIGDAAMVVWLLRKPHTVYINDHGDGITIYTPKTDTM